MSDLDPELKAMQAVLDALEPLDKEAQDRVIEYAFTRLGISSVDRGASGIPPEPAPRVEPAPEPDGKAKVVDVRTLREEKQPKSANEMAAIVGYYLAELAPPDERKTEITTEDIERLFKSGRYPLPQVARKTLPNAAAAGYFESVGGGSFKLNPVGYNLVAHTLPRAASTTRTRRRATPKKATAKKATAKKTKTAKRAAKPSAAKSTRSRR
jgi:hypothetical protein